MEMLDCFFGILHRMKDYVAKAAGATSVAILHHYGILDFGTDLLALGAKGCLGGHVVKVVDEYLL